MKRLCQMDVSVCFGELQDGGSVLGCHPYVDSFD